MPTAIGYRSYIVRIWHGAVRANAPQVILPALDDVDMPQWLARALAGGSREEPPTENSSGSPEEPPLFYAKVEHIQTGEGQSFDSVNRLLDFLRGFTPYE